MAVKGVKRYWPGRAPEWADDHAGDDEDNIDIQIEKGYDRRLSRLSENWLDDKEEIRADHRRIRQAETVSIEEEEKLVVEEDDEDAVYERRRMLKEKLLQREKEAMIIEEEEEESEYETDSEDEQMGSMAAPVFVKKSERDTIAEREKIEAEEREIEEFMKMRVEERKVETKRMVVEEIRKNTEVQKIIMETNSDVDTDDDETIYESWIPREMARNKRDIEVPSMVKEKEEIERVRNMTEEEREDWERKNKKPPKKKRRYMQRYYHKGVFFQDDPDDIAGTAGVDGRDYSAPTGDDKMDRTRLPKVMQVKHFGRSGRTKWTHLVNEDTTDWNNP